MIARAFVSSRVLVDGALRPAAVLVDERGVIVDVVPSWERPLDVPAVDVVDDVLMPGLVDTHVHMNEPGRTTWEGFATATRAAAAGGITTLVDMPLNSIPATTSVRAFEEKLDAARGQLTVDVGFWGGVVPGNSGDLVPLIRRGVLGFKAFLVDSGVPEFQHVGEQDLDVACATIKDADVPILAHAELQGPIDAVKRALRRVDRRTYRYHLASRPKAAENEAVAMLVRLCAKHKAPLHVVHHSSSEALVNLEFARANGWPITAETCPHYLSFCAEEIPDGATWFKCTPPIRERDNREALWTALRSGVLDAVVSDHSPCTAALKKIDSGDFDAAWGGISSLQLTLAATWSGARARGASIADLSRWMSEHPAKLARLSSKGAIAKGRDADLVAFDPEAAFVVDQHALAHKNKITPYHDMRLLGVVRGTWLRGEPVYRRGSEITATRGRTLLGSGGMSMTNTIASFEDLVDLASDKLGGAAVLCSDDFFAGMENLVKAKPPIWDENAYTDQGKWMDGWESKRSHRENDPDDGEHEDYCVVRLGAPGVVRGVVIDTAFFRGNYPSHAALEGTSVDGHPNPSEFAMDATWVPILDRVALRGDHKNAFAVDCPQRFTHVRLRIFPDGGVARLRVFGEPLPAWAVHGGLDGTLDLASCELGGLVVACSDMFFGSRHNLLFPSPPSGMHDGWETRRARRPGFDWAVVRLAACAMPTRLIVDTSHFKGNCPESFALDGGCFFSNARRPDDGAAVRDDAGWQNVLERTPLVPHTKHVFHRGVGAGP